MFYQYFTVPQGSYSTRVYEFTRRWVKAGDEVTVITSVYDKSGITPSGFLHRFTVEGVDVRMINIGLSNKHGFLVRVLTFLAYALIASWYALTFPADVVISSSGPLTVGIPGLISRHVRGIPFVFEVRDLWPEGAIQLGILRNPIVIRLARWLERRCYLGASMVVALSDGMAQWIKTTYSIPQVAVITNASDNELVAEARKNIVLPPWTKGKELVLYTGSIGLIDDCAQILDIAHLFQLRGEENVEFVVVGEGKERAELEQRSMEMHLRHVRFLGSKPKIEVMQWLLSARCALFTVKDVEFLSTASPNKLFDAFAAGVPVVQTTQGWIKDLFDREDCGITVNPGDVEAMSVAAQTLIHNPEVRKRKAAHALKLAMEKFDRTLLAQRYREILLRAIQGKKSGGIPETASATMPKDKKANHLKIPEEC